VTSRWSGIDVGGPRKGFHLAVVDESLAVQLGRARTADEAEAWLRRRCSKATAVGIDSPAAWADDGERSRACERAFARAGFCGIRFTPDRATATSSKTGYYDWIAHGLELWSALHRAGFEVIECFPTASWTAWFGPRSGSRARWTRQALADLVRDGLAATPAPRNQDERDAVAAALTARQWSLDRGSTTSFGPLVVPRKSSSPW
jgi:predicted nuclease with RNAse H fold